MEVEVNGKKFPIKTILYKDIIKIGKVEPEIMAKKLLQLATDISDEEYDNLSMQDGIKLQKAINQINTLEDFQGAQ